MPSERHKRMYDECIAAGKCPKCRKADAAPGKIKCELCIAKQRVYNATTRHSPQKGMAVARKLGLVSSIKPQTKPAKAAKGRRRKGGRKK